MTSIIYQLYDFNPVLRHMSYYSIANIIKYTDGPYELMVIDNEPKYPIDDGYGIIKKHIDYYVVNEKDKGCFASYNQGAELTSGDPIVFIQNDVFVHEGWLSDMKYYIDEGLADVVYPDQVPRDRKFMIDSYNLPHKKTMFGQRDAGMMMMSREAFEKTGGWNSKITTSIIGWKDMFERIDKANLVWTSTCKTMVTHIMAGNNLSKDPKVYEEQMRKESEILT